MLIGCFKIFVPFSNGKQVCFRLLDPKCPEIYPKIPFSFKYESYFWVLNKKDARKSGLHFVSPVHLIVSILQLLVFNKEKERWISNCCQRLTLTKEANSFQPSGFGLTFARLLIKNFEEIRRPRLHRNFTYFKLKSYFN